MQHRLPLLRLMGLFVLGLLSPRLAQATEIKLWHAYRGAEEQALVEAAQAWKELSGVVVVPVALPFGAFDSKAETAIPRGNGPDLLIASHSSLGKWAGLGIVEATGTHGEAHRAEAEQALTIEGTQYGYPLAFKTLVLLYDPARVASPPKTTNELIAVAKQNTGDGAYGLVYEATAAYYHAPWMHAFGADISQGSAADLDTQAHAQALAFSRRLGLDEAIVPKSPSSELMSSLYNSGKAAFIISGPWFVGDISREIAASPLPIVSETGEPARPYLTVEGVFVAQQAKHPTKAHAFARWLAGPAGATIRQQTGVQAVTLASMPPSTNPVIRAVELQVNNAVLMPTDPTIPNVWEALERALRRVMRGAASPEDATREAAAYLEVFSRPAPPAASSTPYYALLGLVIAGFIAWFVLNARDPVLRHEVRKHRRDYLWVLPAALAMTTLVALPFVTGAALSLFAHIGGEWTFVGLRHFADILLSRDWPMGSPMSFFYTLGVTVLWTVTNVCLHVSIGIVMALVLREPWIRLRGLWRALLIIPWAIPNYITALIWKTMFHVQFGAINALLTAVVGGDQPVELEWFGSFALAFSANLITNTWLGFPFMMVVTLGALQSIPRDLEEAAIVDGAGWWFRFRHVVWPLLKPALLPAIIIGSVWTFNMFNVVYLVSAGEPDGSTEILISEAYRWAFSRNNRYGYAAAYAVIIFGVLLVYAKGANRLAGKKVL
jgi:arabinogalactan oligomer / maltooligosaccharide transport system permease protein